jgi:NSS family neurotransmitter:Na+ symporter
MPRFSSLSSALMAQRTSLHGQWSSRLVFILAVTGSAVGLGNFWRFPYIAGENGGGAFVLVYLGCVFAIALPIMMSEVLLGRRGRRNPITTMQLLGEEEAGQPVWRIVGFVGMLAGILILSFYSVIAGWSFAYAVKAASGAFVALDSSAVGALFRAHTRSWVVLGAWHTVFMCMTVAVVARGVERGLERAVQVIMPLLLILVLVLVGHALHTGGFMQGAAFVLRPDFSALTPGGALVALGHAFFSLSLGMGVLMAYGAYLPQDTSIAGTTLVVVIADTVIGLLAALAVFPIVFTHGLNPAEGPGLAFETLPLAFGEMRAGVFVATTFFVLLTVAAWTAAIGLLEPAVAWLSETRGMARPTAAMRVGVVVWLLGFLTVFSFNVLKNVHFWRGTLYANLDYLAVNILLPLSGLSITLFAGWVMCRNSSAQELDGGTGSTYRLWRFLTRFVAPFGVVLLLINAGMQLLRH